MSSSIGQSYVNYPTRLAHEYVTLQLGLSELLARYEPRRLDMYIDSMTVIRDVWSDNRLALPIHVSEIDGRYQVSYEKTRRFARWLSKTRMRDGE